MWFSCFHDQDQKHWKQVEVYLCQTLYQKTSSMSIVQEWSKECRYVSATWPLRASMNTNFHNHIYVRKPCWTLFSSTRTGTHTVVMWGTTHPIYQWYCHTHSTGISSALAYKILVDYFGVCWYVFTPMIVEEKTSLRWISEKMAIAWPAWPGAMALIREYNHAQGQHNMQGKNLMHTLNETREVHKVRQHNVTKCGASTHTMPQRPNGMRTRSRVLEPENARMLFPATCILNHTICRPNSSGLCCLDPMHVKD